MSGELLLTKLLSERDHEIARLRAIIRVNALRWGHSHAEVDAILDPPKKAPKPDKE